jgi:hypothetical protein
MWQTFLWASAIGVAFCIWDSLSRSNAELESHQRAVADPDPKHTEDTPSVP